jgi:uncharacterized membrane protein YraQ (UPF0718 family)
MNSSFYLITLIALGGSWYYSPSKTKTALLKAWKAFENILPQMIGLLLLIGLVLSILSPNQISTYLGNNSGYVGVMIAAIIGSITLIPGYIAFPLSAALLDNGAGYMQIAAFVSTLMMVGIVTIPLEISYFGKRATYLRNGIAFIFSLLVAIIMGWLMQ